MRQTADVPPFAFDDAVDYTVAVFRRAGLNGLVVDPEQVTAHVAVHGERGIYRVVPTDTGLHVWFVPFDGEPHCIARPATPARAAGAILDHREGVPA